MLKDKTRFKNIGLWVSIACCVLLALRSFGVQIGDETVGTIINAVCSFLVMCGIISDPTKGSGYLDGVDEGEVDGAVTVIKALIGDKAEKNNEKDEGLD